MILLSLFIFFLLNDGYAAVWSVGCDIASVLESGRRTTASRHRHTLTVALHNLVVAIAFPTVRAPSLPPLIASGLEEADGGQIAVCKQQIQALPSGF